MTSTVCVFLFLFLMELLYRAKVRNTYNFSCDNLVLPFNQGPRAAITYNTPTLHNNKIHQLITSYTAVS